MRGDKINKCSLKYRKKLLSLILLLLGIDYGISLHVVHVAKGYSHGLIRRATVLVRPGLGHRLGQPLLSSAAELQGEGGGGKEKTNPKWTFDAPNTSTIVSFLITTSVMFFWFVVKLSMVDSIYYVFTTLSTLGFGDLSLVSRSSRLLWPVRMVTLVLSLIGVYLIGSFSAYVVAGRLDLAPTTSSSPARRSIQSMPSVIFLFLVGSFSLWKLEPSLTFADSVYFVFSTLTTLGLGDVVCKTALGKLFIGVFSIVGAMVFGAVLGCVAIIPLQAVQKKERELAMDEIPDELNRETFEYLINGERVRYLELSQDPKYCTRDEFTLLMLVDLGIVEEEDLAMCREKFEKLDVDNSGRITKRDLDLLAARNVVRKVAAKVLYSWLPFGKGRGRTAMQEEEAEEIVETDAEARVEVTAESDDKVEEEEGRVEDGAEEE